AAAVAGGKAEEDSDHGGDQRRAEADGQIGPRREDEPREDVAPVLVGPEQELARRVRERRAPKRGGGGGGEQARGARSPDEGCEQQKPDLEPRVVAQPAHDLRIRGSTMR